MELAILLQFRGIGNNLEKVDRMHDVVLAQFCANVEEVDTSSELEPPFLVRQYDAPLRGQTRQLLSLLLAFAIVSVLTLGQDF